MHVESVLKKPIITEKSATLTDDSNRYGFIVDLKANKYQVRDAVEKFYDVKVLNVRTSITPGKVKRVGKSTKKAGKIKKAYVQLEDGQKIEFFKGV